MRSSPSLPTSAAFPRPGKALLSVMVGLTAIWVFFAIGINWGGAGADVFQALVGSTARVLRGEIWRLFTAPLLHVPSGEGAVGHIVSTMLGLYFLGPSLEKRWGARKFVGFLYGSAVFGFVVQMLAELVLPRGISSTLGQPWFGSVGAVSALAIAWALSFQDRQVALMFVLPVSARTLVIFIVGLSVLRLISASAAPEGLISPFGAMLFGWIVGGGNPPPIRRWWLQYRLGKLKQARIPSSPRKRAASDLRVVDGGLLRRDESKTRDKHWLN